MTERVNPTATAASAAFPPIASTSRPASAAVGSSATTPPMKPLMRRTSEPGPLTPPPMNVFFTSLRVPHALAVTHRLSATPARIRLKAAIGR